MGWGERSTLEKLGHEHPGATPVIVGGALDQWPTLSPEEVEELIERSLEADGWSLQQAYERDLHDRQQRRLKEIKDVPEILIRDWKPPETVNSPEVTNHPCPHPLYPSTNLTSPNSP